MKAAPNKSFVTIQELADLLGEPAAATRQDSINRWKRVHRMVTALQAKYPETQFIVKIDPGGATRREHFLINVGAIQKRFAGAFDVHPEAKQQIAALKERMQEMRQEMAVLKRRCSGLRNDIDEIRRELVGCRKDPTVSARNTKIMKDDE